MASEFFGHLLGAPELDGRCRYLLRQNNPGGFEAALSVLQKERGTSLRCMEEAVISVFSRMNAAFLATGFSLEFLHGQHEAEGSSVKKFLAKFDAIFSLNQDLLLESGYCAQAEPPQSFSSKWSGYSFPGMLEQPRQSYNPSIPRWCGRFAPSSTDTSVSPPSNTQPIYKLHGSANWTNETDGELLIMGGEKVDAINGSSVLKAYAQEFERRLKIAGTRLVIIGYSFGDHHINSVIESAAALGGLKIFIVDPRGYEAPNPQKDGGVRFRAASPVTQTQACVAGFSCRTLAEIFGASTVERENLFQFMRG